MARKSRYTDPVQADVPEQAAYQAAQYGRLSVEDGDDIERNSIGNQRKIAAHYAMGRDDIVIVEHYFDNGYSGMNYDRPDFQRMMEDVERGKINCIIVKDLWERICEHQRVCRTHFAQYGCPPDLHQ